MKPILRVITLVTAMLVSTPYSFVWETQQSVQEFFYLDYIIIPIYNRVTRILTLTLALKFEIL